MSYLVFFLFFFNDTATTEIYTLSLHDALPILQLSVIDLALIESVRDVHRGNREVGRRELGVSANHLRDRKSTRLNSSHSQISYAVFCLKKKNHTTYQRYASSMLLLSLLHSAFA